MNCLNVLDGTDPMAAMQVRMAVYEEQIQQLQQYTIAHPQHKEYYDSVVSHLNSWIEICQERILQLAEVPNGIQ